MKKISVRILMTLLVAALASAACNPFAIVPSTQVPPTPVVQVIPAATATSTSIAPASTEMAAEEPTTTPTQPEAAGPARLVMFDKAGQFAVGYDAEGKVAYTIPTPGMEYPMIHNTSLVDGAIYYVSPGSSVIMRATENEAVRVNLPTDKNLYGMTVSPDDKMIAWSSFYGDFETAHSTLWIANTDGSNVREVLTYSAQQAGGTPSAAFDLLPLGWTDDGKLLFDRAITGVGGYILFFGSNSLYSYDPATSHIETIVPAEENHALSLDSYRLDLKRVAFNSRGQDMPIVLRNLEDQSETKLPLLNGSHLGGSVRFSPSGIWIAYAVAASNPDDEAGDVVIVPADLSADPESILHIAGNRAPFVRGWLDEDTIVFTTNAMDGTGQVWSIHRDGTGLTQLGEGIFLGMVP